MAPTRELVLWFGREYFRVFRSKYPVSWGRHGAEAKRLLELYPLGELKEYVTEYMERKGDPFDAKAGRKFELLRGQLPALIEKRNRRLESEAMLGKATTINGDAYDRLQRARATAEATHRDGMGDVQEIPAATPVGFDDGD
jgi:hypothetical protein